MFIVGSFKASTEKPISQRKNETMARSTACMLTVLLFFPATISAHTFECGHESNRDLGQSAYPYDIPDVVRVKIVYVAFPVTAEQGVPNVVTWELHNAVMERAKHYIRYNSHELLTLSDSESNILLPPGQIFDATHSAQTWEAQLDPLLYQNYYGHDLPPSYSYWYLQNWWSAESCDASPLAAEIMEKIRVAYPDELNPFPWDEASGQNRWLIWLVCLSNLSPYCLTSNDISVGGKPSIGLRGDIVHAETDYFDGVDFAVGSTTQCAEYDYIENDHVFNTENTLYNLVHEFAHTMGPLDGPPGLQSDPCAADPDHDTVCEGRYFFGNMNLMGQSYVEGYGIPPIADPWLQMLPWNPVVEVAETYRDLKIVDVRKGGAIYRFNRPLPPGQTDPEYFLLAYHGADPDIQDNPYIGRGLAIWHCVGNELYDLESAVGLWDYADAFATEFYYPNEHPVVENSIHGYDNYDFWEWGLGYHYDQCRIWDDDIEQTNDVEHNRGCGYDFFGTTYFDENYVRKTKFTPWSNPSCQWYNEEDTSALYLRRRVQDRPNSLIVHVEEEGVDEDGLPFAIVDLLPGPCGEITYPTGSLPEPQHQCLVQWTPEYGDYINTVDILYSNNGGITYPYKIETGVLANATNTSYLWTVTSEYATSNGRLKLVFHNSICPENQGTAISMPFPVSGDYTVQEEVLMPTGGEQWYTGQQQELRWTSYFNSEEKIRAEVDVDYSRTGGEPWSELAEDVTYELIEPQGGVPYNRAYINAPYVLAGPEVWLRLRFRYQNPGGPLTMGFDVADGPVVVYPVERVFSDATAASNLTYQGRPYSAIALEASSTPDQFPDLFVTIADAAGTPQENSVLYLNVTGAGQSPRFTAATTDVFVSSEEPELGSLGACAAPLVAGQPDALFVTHQDQYNSRLYIFGNDPSEPTKYANVADLDVGAWFSAAAVTDSLFPSTCAAWCDIDHDGDLDLHVGRGGIDGGEASDVLFENRGPGAPTRFARHPGVLFPATSRRSMVWFDRDSDWQWDVLLGGAGGSGTLRFHWREQKDLGWSVEPRDLPGTESSALSLTTVDDDRDGDLDVLLVNNSGSVSVLTNAPHGFDINPVVGSVSGGSATVGDVDLDGWPDIVVAGQSEATAGLQLLRNLRGWPDYHQSYQDYTLGSGFSGQFGAAHGSLLADLDNDADLDVLVGRLAPDGRLFSSSLPTQDGLLPPLWLRVRLGPESVANPASIGAAVTLYEDAAHTRPLGMQIVDGGSGRGSQGPRSLLFGLGNFTGNVYVKAVWPRGHMTSITYTGGSGDLTVNPDLSLDLVSGRPPKFTVSFSPALGQIVTHWKFEWWTDGWTIKANDRVEVTSGSGCSFEPIWLVPGNPGVSGTSVPILDGGMLIYHHTLTWAGAPCYPLCTIHYRLEGNDGEGHALSTNESISSLPKICPLSQ